MVDPEGAVKSRSVEWERYNEIKAQIFSLMKEADKIAVDLQAAVLTHEA